MPGIYEKGKGWKLLYYGPRNRVDKAKSTTSYFDIGCFSYCIVWLELHRVVRECLGAPLHKLLIYY